MADFGQAAQAVKVRRALRELRQRTENRSLTRDEQRLERAYLRRLAEYNDQGEEHE